MQLRLTEWNATHQRICLLIKAVTQDHQNQFRSLLIILGIITPKVPGMAARIHSLSPWLLVICSPRLVLGNARGGDFMSRPRSLFLQATRSEGRTTGSFLLRCLCVRPQQGCSIKIDPLQDTPPASRLPEQLLNADRNCALQE